MSVSGIRTTITFVWNFLRNPRRNASVVPSSPKACKAMFQGIAFEKLTHVIELGAGTGCFTQELYDNVPEGCSVMVIELNPDYIPPLKEKYGHRFEIIQGSAADVDVLLEERGWSQVDLIVSGLPFTLPVEVMQPLMKTLQKWTESGTVCRWFTYFPGMMERRYERFPFRRLRTVFLNFPPMWIYTVN